MNKKEKFYSFKYAFKSVLDIIVWTALIILIIIAVFLVYYVMTAKIYEKKGIDYEPKIALYTIISPSMEPNVKVYDVVVDFRVDDVKDIEVGDIITFISTSKVSANLTVTHRVVDIIEQNNNIYYKTKGDNNLKEDDALVDYNSVIGKSYFIVPQLGRIQFLLASKGGWFLVVLVPAIGVIIYDFIKLIKLISKKNIKTYNGISFKPIKK